MATIKLEVGDYLYTVQFNVVDLYMATPLGCHAGAIGAVCSHIAYKDGFTPSALMPRWAQFGEKVDGVLGEADVHRKVMDWMVEHAAKAFGGWTKNPESGGTYTKKGHWLVSAPWGPTLIDRSPFNLGTPEMMDLIAQFCDAEPEKYGKYVMSEGSDCGAHENNKGRPCTRTLIWNPPYIGFWKGEKLTTRASGVYRPVPLPKPVPPPQPVVEQAPTKKTKKLPPRPKRKEYVWTKATPKKRGPQPRKRYARAA